MVTRRRQMLYEIVRLLLWLTSLISYFAPWIVREPRSAALAWNAYDMFDLLRFLPEIETGAVDVNLQALRLPLVGLAVLLPALLANFSPLFRIIGAGVSLGLAALTLPPYPQIVTAWRTPGWRVPFWWAVGAMVCAAISVRIAPRYKRARHWWIIGVVQIAILPAIVTLQRLLPPLQTLHRAPVKPGAGFWGCTLALSAVGLLTWARSLAVSARGDLVVPISAAADDTTASRQPTLNRGPAKGGKMEKTKKPETDTSSTQMSRIREVKAKYETRLLNKANVVAVGIGMPVKDGKVTGSPGIVVSVTQKVDAQDLDPEDLVPQELEEVPVWVAEIEHPHPTEHKSNRKP